MAALYCHLKVLASMFAARLATNSIQLAVTMAATLDIASWLQQELRKRDWTQADLARRMGSSTGSVAHWVTGARVPQPSTIKVMAETFGADTDYLLTLAGHRQPDPYYDPDSPESQLLPYIRAIEWTDRDLKMIKRQLEFLAETKRGEHDR